MKRYEVFTYLVKVRIFLFSIFFQVHILLWIKNYNLVDYINSNIKKLNYLISVNENKSNEIFFTTWKTVLDNIINIANDIWMTDLTFVKIWDDIFTNEKINYQWNRLLIHTMGFSGLLD